MSKKPSVEQFFWELANLTNSDAGTCLQLCLSLYVEDDKNGKANDHPEGNNDARLRH